MEVQIYLGEIEPDCVELQIYADPQDTAPLISEAMSRQTDIPGTLNGYVYTGSVYTERPYTDFTPRVVAYHPDALTPTENNLILWWSGTPEVSNRTEPCR